MVEELNLVTYIGHATTLIRLDNVHILSDPVFSERINFRLHGRNNPPGIPLEKLPKIDAILISHEHTDHLDKGTLLNLSRDIKVIVPSGLRKKILNMGFSDVQELGWQGNILVKNVRITSQPVAHWGIFSKASSYVLEGSKTIYFAGDTGLFDGMEGIGARFNIHLALLPIEDYYPHLWFIPGLIRGMRNHHMAPDDVPDAIKMLRCKRVIPIHWGTFKISGTPLAEPPERMKSIIRQYMLEGMVILLNHGDTFNF